MIVLRFSAEQTLASRLVRAATWSWCSHVDLALPGGRLLGAVPGVGVVERQVDEVEREEIYAVDAPLGVLSAAASQLGKPYDWAGVLGIGLHRDWAADDAWFCSELVAWAFQTAGLPLLRADHASRITPRDLLLSPRLIPLAQPTHGC